MRGWVILLGAVASCAPTVVESPDPCGGPCPQGFDCERGICVSVVARNDLLELRILPAAPTLGVDETLGLTARGRFADGSDLDITSSVTWSSEDDATARVDPDGTVHGVADGITRVHATSGTVDASVEVAVGSVPPAELRALWVTRWNFRTAADVRNIFTTAQAAGFNTVFFQVRGRADAFYASTLEPWGSELTGTLGQDPGFDPLAVAIAEGDARGMEVHAWLNTVPAWSGSAAPTESTPRHVYLDHPEWIMADPAGIAMPLGSSGYLCLSPGIPAVQDHLIAVVDDIVSGYAVDGIHLDYIRYYGRQYSHDAVSNQRYADAVAVDAALTREDWQRDQVTEIVRRAYTSVQARAGVKLTAAVWHNNDLNVFGSSGYRDYYQDSHAWTEEGILDAIVPMNYFRIDSNPAFDELADDHLANRAGRHVYMGVHVLGRSSEPDPTGAKMLENIEYARSIGADGVALFAWSYLEDNGLWSLLATGPFAQSARVPQPTWR